VVEKLVVLKTPVGVAQVAAKRADKVVVKVEVGTVAKAEVQGDRSVTAEVVSVLEVQARAETPETNQAAGGVMGERQENLPVADGLAVHLEVEMAGVVEASSVALRVEVDQNVEVEELLEVQAAVSSNEITLWWLGSASRL